MPYLHLITNMFDQQRYEIIKEKLNNENTILKIKNLKLDIIGFDENHFSGTTNLS